MGHYYERFSIQSIVKVFSLCLAFRVGLPGKSGFGLLPLCLTIEPVLTPEKSHKRTTDSRGVIRFDNLTKDIQLTGADQLWVSDITYFEVQLGKTDFYIGFQCLLSLLL